HCLYSQLFFFFFFSSRRRHTRWPRDWSSDVCSSDLVSLFAIEYSGKETQTLRCTRWQRARHFQIAIPLAARAAARAIRLASLMTSQRAIFPFRVRVARRIAAKHRAVDLECSCLAGALRSQRERVTTSLRDSVRAT